jgi:hypothetical protein
MVVRSVREAFGSRSRKQSQHMSGKRIVLVMIVLILAIGGGVAFVARQTADERKRMKELHGEGRDTPASSTNTPREADGAREN